MEAIASQTHGVTMSEGPRREFARLLKDNHRHCLEWLCFFCNQGTFIIPAATFMLAIFDVDDDLRQMLLASPSVVDLILNMWMQQDEEGRYHIRVDGDRGCPLLRLFSHVADDSVGYAALQKQLQAHPLEIGCIADTMERRIHALRHLLLTSLPVSTSFAVRHLHGLLRIIQQLLYKKKHSLEFFDSRRLLYQISFTLNVALCTETRSSVWVEVPDLLGYLHTFILRSDATPGSALAKVISAVHGGIIHVLVKSLLYIPTSLESYPLVAQFLRDITAYAAYRNVAPCLIVMLNSEFLHTVFGARTPGPVFDKCWEEVLYALRAHDDDRGPRIAERMCDYLEVSANLCF
jgi:hypothetical protein